MAKSVATIKKYKHSYENIENNERRRRELTETNSELVRNERNTARADLTRMTNDLQTRTTERDDAGAKVEQRNEELEASMTERDNLQNRLNEADINLMQREKGLQTRTTERMKA